MGKKSESEEPNQFDQKSRTEPKSKLVKYSKN